MPKIKKMQKNIKCHIFVEKGLKGTENQCLALAHELGLDPKLKHPVLRWPWTWIAPTFRIGKKYAYRNTSDLFQDSPDILITSGRKSVLAALEVKKRSLGKTFVIQLMNPRIDPKHFDLVIAPAHDGLGEDNVINIQGALHKITPAFLDNHKGHYDDVVQNLPSPRIAVLIGGTTTKSEFTDKAAFDLGKTLTHIAGSLEGSLMVTASRRTHPAQEKILRQAVKDTSHHFWDGQGENPYFDYLKNADYIVCTNDSVSMISEALGTQKPVFIAPIGTQGKRIEKFNSLLQEKGFVKPISMMLEHITQGWQPQRSNDMMTVITEIKKRYAAHRSARSGED